MGSCRPEGVRLVCVGSWSLAGIRSRQGCPGSVPIYVCLEEGRKPAGTNQTILVPSAATHPDGQCPEKRRRCGLDMAGLSAERGIGRPVLGVLEGEASQKTQAKQGVCGSVSPQGLAIYRHS